MDEMNLLRWNLKIFTLGELAVNSYFIFHKEKRKGIIIDAPSGVEEIFSFAHTYNIDILYIIITHCHFDHIQGLEEVEAPFYVFPKEQPLLQDSRLNLSEFFLSPLVIKKKPQILGEGVLEDGIFNPFCIFTPGHSPGSVSIRIDNCLFVGDVIFANSIGRTDIPGASYPVLVASIKKKIFTLPEEMVIYPGHGEKTTVGEEKQNNIFLT